MNGCNFLKCTISKRELLFLIDTGASVSIIFDKYVNKNKIDISQRMRLNGIGNNSISSLGEIKITLSIDEVVEVEHNFKVVKEFGNKMHGILGSDFFIKYSANIDYEKFLLSLLIKGKRRSVPMISDYDSFTVIPPRCEIIKHFRINNSSDCVVLPRELCDSVFVAGTLVRPEDNMVPVRFLNVSEKEIKIRNFSPTVENLENYSICSFDTNNISVKRVEELLAKIKLDTLNKEEKLSVAKICAKFADVFHLEDDPLTVANIPDQKIYLKEDAVPTYRKPYRLPYAQKTEIHKQLDEMLKHDIIEKAQSEWSSPLLIVPKKMDPNGIKKWRVVVDYRELNKRIRDDKFPLPCISEILDSLSGAMVFSHLDLTQSYYQLSLDPSSRPYTAFTTDRAQYQMKRLPMGLKTSPSSFSRAMTIALAGLNYESCFLYLDDIIVFGKNLNEHNKNLVKVLQRLRQVNLKLNPQKCEFLRREMLYLGHVISSAGISPDPKKIECVRQYPKPKNAEEVKRFVAFLNYYRRFIKNFAHIVQPLNQLTRKNVKFLWDDNCQKAFETLKTKLINPPILQYPDFSDGNQFILKTDASGFAISAILSNSDDTVIAYASRALNKAERNYCTIQRELLAIVWGIQHFRPYLYARKFLVHTDHRPLVYLFSMTNPSSRLTKFRLILEEYDFKIVYVRGPENAADALSRIEIDSNDLVTLGNQVVYVTTRGQSKQASMHTKQTGKDDTSANPTNNGTDHPGLVELLKRPTQSVEVKPVSNIEFRKVANIANEKHNCYRSENLFYEVSSQVIYINQNPRSTLTLEASLRDLKSLCVNYKINELCIVRNKDVRIKEFIEAITKNKNLFQKEDIKLCVIKGSQIIKDKELRQLILNDFHMLPTGGHAGINRMLSNVKKHYFWVGIKKDVEDFVRRCDDCQRYKHSVPNKEPLSITTTAASAFQKVYLDLVGPLPPDAQNNRYVLTLQCELSKFVEAYPIENKESATVAKTFVNEFVLRFGIPSTVVHDQGTEFLSNVFKDTCRILGVNQLNSTAYHHETLGSLENSHKNLNTFLRIQVSKQADNWSSWIPFWCFSYNTTTHTETKYSPYELVFGKSAILPSNVNDRIDPLYNFDNYPLELKYRLQVACQDGRNNLIISKNKRKSVYDTKIRPTNYNAGDKVLVKNETGSKLEQLYNGPYEVVKENSPNITLKIDNKEVSVHKNRVKPYFENK